MTIQMSPCSFVAVSIVDSIKAGSFRGLDMMLIGSIDQLLRLGFIRIFNIFFYKSKDRFAHYLFQRNLLH
jgi:hypothetical protein